jgi:ankyrin repeat protein
MREAAAHETDHFTPPPRREYAELGPAFTEDFYQRIVQAVDDANERIRDASSEARREWLRSPDGIARAVCARFGVAGFYIEEVERFVHSAHLKARYPGRLTAYRAKPCIYDEALLPVDPRQFYLLWRGSVFVVNGVYVSADKIGHFVHHGYNYYVAYRRALAKGADEKDARYRAVLDVGVGEHFFFSEWRLLGTLTSGVVSNADLAANYVGMLFYINLTEAVQIQGRPQPPMLRLEEGEWRLNRHVRPDTDFLARYFSPHFDEALNPNWYDALTARVMRDVIRKRCARLRSLYVDENGVPYPEPHFLRLRAALSSYHGAPYGHTGMDETHLVSIVNVCFCDDVQNDGDTAGALRRAVVDADTDAVRELLAGGGNPDSPAEEGPSTPAALRGATVLHAAARAGQVDIVESLLLAGADPMATTARGETPLHVAADRPTARRLLSAGASPHARDTLERTPLHWASRAGRLDVVAGLLEAGAHPDAADCDGETALHVAARAGNEDLVALLLRHGSQPNTQARYGTSPLHLATRQGHAATVARLLAARAHANARDAFGCTPLHDAAAGGDASLVAALIEAGADPHAPDALGKTPAQVAAKAGHLEVVRVLESSVSAGKGMSSTDRGRATESDRRGRSTPAPHGSDRREGMGNSR